MQTPGEVSLVATGGAYFNAGLTQSSSATTITRNAANQTGTITIYFAKNQTASEKTYTVNATGNIGEAGETGRSFFWKGIDSIYFTVWLFGV